VELEAAIQPNGLCSGFVYGPANTEEHFLAEALFAWRQDPTQPPPTAAGLADRLGPAHRQRGRRQGPTGPVRAAVGAGVASGGPYLSDLGLRGTAWRQHWAQDYGAVVLLHSDYRPKPTPAAQRAARRWFKGLRQVVETAFDWLEHRFGLWYPRARTATGLCARLGAKLAAFNVAVIINHRWHRKPFAFLSVFD
jgi:hypothetical protein